MVLPDRTPHLHDHSVARYKHKINCAEDTTRQDHSGGRTSRTVRLLKNQIKFAELDVGPADVIGIPHGQIAPSNRVALAEILQCRKRLQQPDAGAGDRPGQKADAGDDQQHAHRPLGYGEVPLHPR